MKLSPAELVGVIAGTSFAAGLNVYATVAALGLLARAGVVALPPGLQRLESWWVIAPAVALFVIEFFADKIPAFDLLWNALHTFVRVPVAGLLAYAATAQLSPSLQIAGAALGALVAFAAHGGKTAARAAVTPSPEPISNVALSMGEDVLAVALVWFATTHPYVAGAIVAVLLLLVIVMVRLVARAFRALFRGATRASAADRRPGDPVPPP